MLQALKRKWQKVRLLTPCRRSGPFLDFKGIIRPFQLKLIVFFYYSIDAREFSCSNDMQQTTIRCLILGRNRLFNFDEMVLDYVKTGMDSPALFSSFSKQSPQIENFFNNLETKQTTTSGAGETNVEKYSWTVVIEQKRIQKRHSLK